MTPEDLWPIKQTEEQGMGDNSWVDERTYTDFTECRGTPSFVAPLQSLPWQTGEREAQDNVIG